jgi:lipopolysaccharide/colanic/teichoic acid biosynthesis glycosyltransferase
MNRPLTVIVTLIALLLLLPIIVITAISIKISMPGPILFMQVRIGHKGKPFTIFKFRSMKLNNSRKSITLSTDSRITPFGQFIRKTKIDELPQLLNILKGDMNIVGPRPDVPGYYDTLTGENQKIWLLRPGLTGLDSMFYPNEQAILDHQPNPQQYYDEVLWPDKVRLNLWYAKNRSLILDLKIILNTATQLLFRKILFQINTTSET